MTKRKLTPQEAPFMASIGIRLADALYGGDRYETVGEALDYLKKTRGWDDERRLKELYKAEATGAVTVRMRESTYRHTSASKVLNVRSRTYIDDIGIRGVRVAFPPPETMDVDQFAKIYVDYAGADASQEGAEALWHELGFRGQRPQIRAAVTKEMGGPRKRGRPPKKSPFRKTPKSDLGDYLGLVGDFR